MPDTTSPIARPHRKALRVGATAFFIALSGILQASENTFALNDPRLSELSGLAPSHIAPGYYWAHNDSGDLPQLFWFKLGSPRLHALRVPAAKAFDWEDMASYRDSSGSYLLVGMSVIISP